MPVVRKLLMILGGLLLVGAVCILAARQSIQRAAHGRTFNAVEQVPARNVALVLGCARQLGDGRLNLYFSRRMAAAEALYRAGKARYFIVSGDNHRPGYDEPTDMKLDLIRRGIPESRIHCDYAGLRTLDSVVRAKEVFGQTRLIIVSQEFHNQRAIYIARRYGIDALGFNAAPVAGAGGMRTELREELARVRTLFDAMVGTAPRFLGPKIQIPGAG